ncbi:RWD domain-containing protein 1 [Anthonomus grandis grandis]|uniref:RWD domain-containing protein 1 n=1 Tax=Anthonomus grandis grandis TaxID=2921223 RepID=UPI002165BDB3|nr:RWD domain-containing protein 1 [Anthonomus grandis grandis]
MDFKEEQKSEIEALESIYYGDFEIISVEPYKFSIPIKTDDYDPGNNVGLSCNLVVTYTPKYPEEAPLIELENAENFHEGFEDKLAQHLHEQVAENLGMVMVFTLVSSAQEWLHEKYEEDKKAKEERAALLQKQQEEAEQKKFEGTRVTIESFLKWRQQFEEEFGIDKKRELAEKEGRKLTGRELFMTDNTLNESDLKFLDEGDRVKVDESLFQDLDDLDLDDDDEDDEDFDPDNYNSDSS